ncbi:hypothetical protein [Pedobacter sp. R20-19]|uniref:hypothetical protein n=1 Tax=Pedobacter sp. R20-19 TaxID=1270196 RepID=UPI00049386E7|nr:hypothetical protein [Pedobacter sp. R20-19]
MKVRESKMKKILLLSLLFLFSINLATKALVRPLTIEISNGSILYDKLPVVASTPTPFTASLNFFSIEQAAPRSIEVILYHHADDGTDTPINNPINLPLFAMGAARLYQGSFNFTLPAGFTTGNIRLKFRAEGESNDNSTNFSMPIMLVPSSNMMLLTRIFNPSGGRHMITASVKEKRELLKIGWQSEGDYGLIKVVQEGSYVPLYRFYRPRADDHVFQPNNPTPPPGYDSEGIAGYVLISSGNDTKAVYKYYNSKSGDRVYTRDAGELAGVRDWQYEGIAFYVQ